MLIRSLIVAAISIVTCGVAATAQTPTTVPIQSDRVITGVNMPVMRAILANYGQTIISEINDGNGVVVRAANGFEYIVLLNRCTAETACQGVLIGTIHDVPDGTTWQMLNQIDSEVDLFGLYIMNDRLVFDRYIALQGGIRIDQFRHEIATLVDTVPGLLADVARLASENNG